jgi:lipoate-protein ligase A
MKVIVSKSNDPYLNQAMEYALLKQEDVLFIYVNKASVIIGRNQNPWQEVHTDYADRSDIPIVRRVSGGGTVYHDCGNINFAFINEKNYKGHYEKINTYLEKHGISTQVTERYDMLYGSNKLSGSAFYRKGDKSIHHFTLLVETSLDDLWQVLKFNHNKFQCKSIKSIRKPVVNLKDINNSISVESIIDYFPGEDYVFDKDELSEYYNKFKSWAWIYGETPKFEYQTSQGRMLIKSGYVTQVNDKEVERKAFKEVDYVSREV